MALGEITGGTVEDLAEMESVFDEQPLSVKHDIPFETAYCLRRISKQPEDYDGPARFCKNRACKLTEEEWASRYDDDYSGWDERAYCGTCNFHGRKIDGPVENLEPLTAAITHGLEARDEHLRMDFTDAEQILYDGIVEQWPEIYGWPGEDEDPARYLILRKVATNVVRSVRCEDYIDDEGEVRISDKYNDEGIVVEPDGLHEENPIAGEYRLLIREIKDMLKELGLTPKERSRMGSQEKSASAVETISEVAAEALGGDDEEYDPERFNDG